MSVPTEEGRWSARIRERALELGFDLVGITTPEATRHGAFYVRWLDQGHQGEMGYLAGEAAVGRRLDLTGTLDRVRSVVVVGHVYGPGGESLGDASAGSAADPTRGIIARYARGRDYHKIIGPRLRRLHRWLEGEVGHAVAGRAYVDTGPILERDLARRSGLGWFGRNTMLIHPGKGSYFLLGELLLDFALQPDPPFEADHCGSCRACLDGCPTGALLGRDEDGAPAMDARLCISYLTIELRGPIPVELRPLIGNRVFGCDICQELCPWNRKFAAERSDPGYAARGPGERPHGVEVIRGEGTPFERSSSSRPHHPGTDEPSLIRLLETALDERSWDAFSRGSAIRRAGRAGFARNVCVAIGNWLASADEPPEEAVAVLNKALLDQEPLVREHAAWALGQKG